MQAKHLAFIALGAACNSDQGAIKHNSQPVIDIISHADGQAIAIDEPLLFRAQVGDSNHALDELEVSWAVDGEIICDWQASSQGGENACTIVVTAGESSVAATVRDPEGATAQDVLTVQGSEGGPDNETPVCSITSPASGGSSGLGQAVYFTAIAVDADDASEDLAALWSSDKDGDLGESLVNSGGDISFSTQDLSPDSHTISLVVSDPQGATCTQSIFFTVTEEPGNLPPEVTSLELDPAAVYTNDVITAAVSASDPEGDAVTLAYGWFVDGALVAASADPLDGSIHFDKNQTVELQVTPSDEFASGTTQSISVDVANSPPQAPAVGIDPSAPTELVDDLICEITGESTDDDNDAVSYAFSWTVDGAVWTGATSSTYLADDTIPAAETIAGETWECTAIPFDGQDYGSAASASVAIAGPQTSDCPDSNCSLDFDGIDDYIEVPHDPSLNVASTGLTVEAWIHYDALTGPLQDCMTAVRKGTTNIVYEYWLHKNLSPADSLFWASSSWAVNNFSIASAGSWLHYAGVADFANAESRTYINGVPYETAGASLPASSTEAMRIGIDWDFGCAMYGLIDEVRISSVPRYTGSFTPDTVFAPDTDTMALYHFDEYGGSTAYDSSGNGNDGIIHGAQWSDLSP
jgi:hypothetical protein